jgi:hypothetical protein
MARLGSAAALGWEPVLIWLVVLTLAGAMNTAFLYALISLVGVKASRTQVARIRTPFPLTCSAANWAPPDRSRPYALSPTEIPQ